MSRSNLQPNIQVLKLLLDSIICSSKCWITKIQKSKCSTWLHKSFLLKNSNNLNNNIICWFNLQGLCRFLLMYFSIHLLEHVLAQFPNLLHFFDFWVCAQEKKKRHTFDWAKTYTIKFLEVGGKSKDQCSSKHS